jgi:hypothetical protein
MQLLISIDEMEMLQEMLSAQHWTDVVPPTEGLDDPDDDEEGSVRLALDEQEED